MIRSFAPMGVAIAATSIGLFGSGCDADPYRNFAPVSGRVTCDGKPATGGTIMFRPRDEPEKTGRKPGHPGVGSIAVIGEDGKFALAREELVSGSGPAGALIGFHHVTFKLPNTEIPRVGADERANFTPEELAELEKQLAATIKVYKPLGCSKTISPDLVEVKPGENVFEFTLQPTTPKEVKTPTLTPMEKAHLRGPK